MAGQYDITIEQGSTFSRVITWKDGAGSLINLTGYSARMKARESIDAVTTFLSITSDDSITLGGAAGTVTITLTATETAAITQSGVYDLELISGAGVVTRLLQGNVTLSKEVTK